MRGGSSMKSGKTSAAAKGEQFWRYLMVAPTMGRKKMVRKPLLNFTLVLSSIATSRERKIPTGTVRTQNSKVLPVARLYNSASPKWKSQVLDQLTKVYAGEQDLDPVFHRKSQKRCARFPLCRGRRGSPRRSPPEYGPFAYQAGGYILSEDKTTAGYTQPGSVGSNPVLRRHKGELHPRAFRSRHSKAAGWCASRKCQAV